MTTIQMSVKNVNKQVFQEFKAEAVRKGIPVGSALTLAMKLWIEKKEKGKMRKLSDLKPWDWGKGNERVSEEIDKILYEENDNN
ncbi:MAG TPA: hypothetical protein VJB87_05545 [Candidatus Nanoarchaeia archaeon]|nr:hypothetical protein [Candidatus Nanoarchaeia archaeon]